MNQLVKQSMFQITKQILEEAESHILKLPSNNKLYKLVTRHFVFPLKYLSLGLGELFKPAKLWAWVAMALLVTGGVVAEQLGVSSEYLGYITTFCIYFPMILIIFSVPSTYAYSGVKDDFVELTAGLIASHKIDTIEKVELFEENLEKIYFRISSRISFYKWLIGATWTLYILFFNVELRLLMNSSGDAAGEAISVNMTSFILIFLSTLAVLILVVGYKRASELLIKSIEFGCVERKHKLLICRGPYFGVVTSGDVDDVKK